MGIPVSDGEAGVLAVPQRPVDALLGHLQQVVGDDIDEPLLLRALTHRSFAYENGGVPNNERLE
ncbi:MAG TPA: ribonuclease III, partial [Intrasporangium sp.]|nr:ribonuclease III [Intrasporangium sp.]